MEDRRLGKTNEEAAAIGNCLNALLFPRRSPVDPGLYAYVVVQPRRLTTVNSSSHMMVDVINGDVELMWLGTYAPTRGAYGLDVRN